MNIQWAFAMISTQTEIRGENQKALSSKPPEEKATIKVIHSSGMPPSKCIDRPYSWQEVVEIVENNRLERFARSQAKTQEYLKFKLDLQEKNTTVYKHLLFHQLRWYKPEDNGGLLAEEVVAQQVPDKEIVVRPSGKALFECEDDLMILPNHFPYYFEADVAHLCVWSKKSIDADPNSPIGDISPAMRGLIERYVIKTFVEGLGIPRENIVWFKNWLALQSVQAISHVHVVIKGITPEQLAKVLYTPGSVL